MKQTPDEQRVQERMAAGVLCRDGFLGDDSRPLREVLRTDHATLEQLGVSHERLAGRLEELLHAATAGLGTPVAVGENLTARFLDAMGPIPCPWGGCGVFAKGEVELTETSTGRTVFFTPLSVHMIERHGFYQGRGSRYRLEPGDLARLLDLTAGSE